MHGLGEIVDFYDPFLGWGLGEIVGVDRDFIQVKYEVWYECKTEWARYLEPRVHKEVRTYPAANFQMSMPGFGLIGLAVVEITIPPTDAFCLYMFLIDGSFGCDR